MTYILIFLNSKREALFLLLINELDLYKIAGFLFNKAWKDEIAEIYFSELNNSLKVDKYAKYFYFKEKPKYGSMPQIADEKIPDSTEKEASKLEFKKLTKNYIHEDHFKGVSAISGIIGGVLIGSTILPGLGAIIGGGVGLFFGSNILLVTTILLLRKLVNNAS